MKIFTLTKLGRKVAFAALIVLPLSIFGRQLSLPEAPMPLTLAQDGCALYLKHNDYEYGEYGADVSRTSKSSYKHYSGPESIKQDFIHYKARNSVLWAIVFPGGGSFSVGRPGRGTIHFSIQVLSAAVSIAALQDSGARSDPDGAVAAAVSWWLIAIGSKIWDAYGSYQYAMEPNY